MVNVRTERYHSTGGYLTVQESPWRTPLATAFVSAGVEMGYENIDFNAQQQTGGLFRTARRSLACTAQHSEYYLYLNRFLDRDIGNRYIPRYEMLIFSLRSFNDCQWMDGCCDG